MSHEPKNHLGCSWASLYIMKYQIKLGINQVTADKKVNSEKGIETTCLKTHPLLLELLLWSINSIPAQLLLSCGVWILVVIVSVFLIATKTMSRATTRRASPTAVRLMAFPRMIVLNVSSLKCNFTEILAKTWQVHVDTRKNYDREHIM